MAPLINTHPKQITHSISHRLPLPWTVRVTYDNAVTS